MKQVLVRKGRISIEDIPAPLVGEGNVLVEAAYSLISTGTEVSGIKRSGESLARKASDPENRKKLFAALAGKGIKKTLELIGGRMSAASPLGYSCSGVIVQVGDGVVEFEPGDRVACAGAGKANHAEIVLVPENLAVKVPDACSLKDAASVALGSIAMQGLRRADPTLGETVAVIGLGLLGQLTIQLLKSAGCRIIGIDPLASRVELASELGLDRGFVGAGAGLVKQISHLTASCGVDSTIITAAAPEDNEIMALAMDITRKKGRVVVVGNVGLAIRRSPFYEKEIDVLISSSYGPGRYDEAYEERGLDYPYAYVRWTERRNMAEYLKLLAEEKVNFSRLVEKVFPAEQAPEAYRTLQKDVERPLAVLLDYGLGESDTHEKSGTKVMISPSRKADNDAIKVAVIGAGNFAKSVHLPNLQRLPGLYSIHAISDAAGLSAKETARQFGAAYCATDYKEILADEDIDMVIVTTRHNLHAKLAMEAARAGKAVFCEKPMALNREELDELVDTLEDTGTLFTIGFNRRFSPAATRAKVLAAQRVNPLVVLYRVNAGYIPLENWVHGEEGGGRIIGEACHMFDLFNYLTGATVESLDVGALSPATKHVSARDNFTATLKYSDGSICTLVYAALGASDFPKEYIEIHFDETSLIINDFKELLVFGSKAKGWKGSQDKGHLKELDAFGRRICGENDPSIALKELVMATKISFLVDSKVGK